eukprot:Gb_21295 [translate_table: standard]
MSITEMEVHMDCGGCEKKIRKALCKLEGVENIEIDMRLQKVTVTGYADQMSVLKAVRNTGKKAEFWPYPYNGEYHAYATQYYYQQSSGSTSTSTYNYETHGHSGSVQGYYQTHPPSSSTIMDDQAASLFSDENPHACSLM